MAERETEIAQADELANPPSTPCMRGTTQEHQRLYDSERRVADWKSFGPYVSERAWGTVREDYSESGSAWDYLPHDHARSRAYRWNEDGLAGICNRFQNICLSVALWNEKDPIIKERLFGLTGNEGNHGEDCKEYYYYLDSTPTHSYMRMMYRYLQVEYPYSKLVEVNQCRSKLEPEYELIDCCREDFEKKKYFDVYIEYAKADQEDILCRITAVNMSSEEAPLHVLPHLWFRNTWSWGHNTEKPFIEKEKDKDYAHSYHRHLKNRYFYAKSEDTSHQFLFTENETNYEKLFGFVNPSPYVKDGINNYVVSGNKDAVNFEKGSKMAAHFYKMVGPGEKFVVETRFTKSVLSEPFENFDYYMNLRLKEADNFFENIHPANSTPEEKKIQRQAFAGLFFSKQFYHYSVELWLNGDVSTPQPPESRKNGRNVDWKHLYCNDVISMPDKWEYPWFAVWDLCFHCIPIAMLDPEWAKRQLILVLREWYMHPNGQIPAYEWAYGDVNPPVHAYAAYQVYLIDHKITGRKDTVFLERIFHKLLLNFTWWVNRKDESGKNVFQGGFLGLDNIGVFDRSAPLPPGMTLEQSDGTAWMGMFSLNMLKIALELAVINRAYEDVATKFFEHFIYIADAVYSKFDSVSLWEEEDGFFYDLLRNKSGVHVPLKIRSFVGLISLYATCSVSSDTLKALPEFSRRLDWFIKYRPDLVKNLPQLVTRNEEGNLLLTMVGDEKLKRVLHRMLDTEEFLSEYGLRSLSLYHKNHPFEYSGNTVSYEPAESKSGLFGGNSNWRGPIWFPVNYLMIDSLRTHYHHYKDSLVVEMPSRSGNFMNLNEVSNELSKRLLKIFQTNENGCRPVNGNDPIFCTPEWSDNILFYEYFHGCEGTGIGASHQTGWTALIAKIIDDIHPINPEEKAEKNGKTATN